MLDSGSQISSVSRSFFQQHLSHLSLQPLSDLQVEGVTGQQVPYSGFIEAKLQLPITICKQTLSMNVLLLVVADTSYNGRTPVLIGTNILMPCLQETVPHSMDSVQASSLWWNTFKCMTAGIQTGGCAGKVINPESVTIKARSCQAINVNVNDFCSTSPCVLIEESDASVAIPGGLMVKPCVINSDVISNGVQLEIMNVSDHDVIIPAKAVVGTLHDVELVTDVVQSCSTQSSTTEPTKHLEMIDRTEWDAVLTEEQKQTALSCIGQWPSVFACSETELGKAEGFQHRIQLEDDNPVRLRYGNVHPSMVEEVRKHLQSMKDMGVIQPSTSPYSSPAVLVRKKTGALRFCIDYRKLNLKCKTPGYSLPRVHEALDCLSGCKWFSSLDLKNGYWQVELHPADRHKSAFSLGPLGFYEWTRMPFGLAAAPASFQQMIETVIGSLNLTECLLYLDDIIVFSRTFSEHVQRLSNVFKKLQEAGLKLNPSKCSFFKTRVKYLGHIISDQGIETCPDKIEAVLKWPVPDSHKELRQFLGFSGFYRRFIENYACIAHPLHELLKGQIKVQNKSNKRKLVPSGKFHWNDSHQVAFDKLKRALTEAPILAYADYSLPYSLSVDASGYSIGAVLYQTQQGQKKVIAYASRGLNEAEKRYPVHKREFLAMKWAITEKFRDYLYYSKFDLYTDNNPLVYVLSTARVDATGHRWLADLSNFSFSIRYKPGPKNKDADALSRICWTEEQVKSSLAGITGVNDCEAAITMQQDIVTSDGSSQVVKSAVEWQKVQRDDSVLSVVIDCLLGHKTNVNFTCHDAKCLMKEKKRLFLENGVLCRKRTVDGESTRQIILPSSYAESVFHSLHTDMGHPGRDKTMELIRDRFYWPKMSQQVTQWIKQCDRCLRRKAVPDVAPLHPITSHQPMELVCIDYLSLESCRGYYKNILVITDHYTRFAHAIATTNQSAKTTARVLLEHFIHHYGFPIRLHSDRGGSFEAQVIKELCQLVGIKRSRTTSYHPQGNGACERMNSSLLGLLGTLTSDQKSRWKDQLSFVVHAYNCMKHESTGFTPFELMYGRQARLPVDLMLSLNQNVNQSYNEYVSELKKKLQYAYGVAEKQIEAMKSRNLKHYKSRGGAIQVNDRVLVKRLAFPEGKHKLSDRWEEDVYVVVNQMDPDIPVYDVKREVNPKGGRLRRLHRNHLLPIGSVQDVMNARDSMNQDQGDEDEDVADEHMQITDDSDEEVETPVNQVQDEEQVDETVDHDDNEDQSLEDSGSENGSPSPRRSTRDRMPVDRYTSIDFRN